MSEERVYPIKDDKVLQQVQMALKHNFPRTGMRNYVIFQVGKMTLLRCSDVVKLKYHDVYDEADKVRKTGYIHDQKTGKINHLYFGPLTKILTEYQAWRKQWLAAHHRTSEWLFPSAKRSQPERGITVNEFYKVMQRVSKQTGIDYLGTHTMRKTGAYRLYEQTHHNIGIVMQALNHSSERMTLHYLGLDRETKQAIFDTIDFG